MATSPMARRVFVGSLVAGVVVGVAAVWWRPARVGRGRLPPFAPSETFVGRLRELLPNDAGRKSAVNAADQALRVHADRWSDAPSALELIGDDSFADALSTIRRTCRRDYDAGRTVSVLGWQISRTEAELIGLLR